MVKKKILWFTADFFIDVDRQLVPYLRKNSEYEIRWVVVQSATGAKIPLHDDYEVWNLHYRAKDPRTFFELEKYFKKQDFLNIIWFIVMRWVSIITQHCCIA